MHPGERLGIHALANLEVPLSGRQEIVLLLSIVFQFMF